MKRNLDTTVQDAINHNGENPSCLPELTDQLTAGFEKKKIPKSAPLNSHLQKNKNKQTKKDIWQFCSIGGNMKLEMLKIRQYSIKIIWHHRVVTILATGQ